MRPEHVMIHQAQGDEITHLIISTVHLVLWAAIIYGLLVLVGRHIHAQDWGKPKRSQDALAAASLRYAKGEITKEEFHQIKEDLDES